MKRIFSIILTFALCSAFIFADEPGDEYDDGYVYTQNGLSKKIKIKVK